MMDEQHDLVQAQQCRPLLITFALTELALVDEMYCQKNKVIYAPIINNRVSITFSEELKIVNGTCQGSTL